VWKHAEKLVADVIDGSGESDMEVYGWEPAGEY